MRKLVRVLVFCMSMIAFLAVPAFSKEGFYIGFGLDYVSVEGSDPWWDTVESGTGFDAKLGWDFGPVAIESTLLGSNHNDTAAGYGDGDFSGLTLDLRVLFGPSDLPTRGFLLVGFGRYAFEQYDPYYDDEVIFRGDGFNIGGGVEHYFNRVLALDARAVYRVITYDEVEVYGDTASIDDMDSDMFNLSIGLSVHF